MVVKELIEILSKLDQDKEIGIQNIDNEDGPTVEVIKEIGIFDSEKDWINYLDNRDSYVIRQRG